MIETLHLKKADIFPPENPSNMRGWIKTSKPECVREVNLKKLSKANLNYFEINIV